jgi:DNA repair photolyase
MIQKLVSNSIPVMIRVDPIIPGLNEDVEPLLKELSDIGINDITTSTYKARSDSLGRIKSVFPDLGLKLEKIYRNSGEYYNHSWYLPQVERERIMGNVAGLAKKFGLGFNVCREGIDIQRTSNSCDGQHLLK